MHLQENSRFRMSGIGNCMNADTQFRLPLWFGIGCGQQNRVVDALRNVITKLSY